MKYKKWDNFKVHCSSISKIITPPRNSNGLNKKEERSFKKLTKQEVLTDDDVEILNSLNAKIDKGNNPPLSETTKKFLVNRYSVERFNIRTASLFIGGKATQQKGFALESDGLQLLSDIDGVNYICPKDLISNDYILGICDALTPQKDKIIEIKTSWNATTFMTNRVSNKLSFENWCQMQGYLEIHDINIGQVCYVLVNTPTHLITQEYANLFKRYTFGEITREKYDEDLEKYETIFDYNKIPMKKRVIRFDVQRDRDFMKKVYKRINLCREYLAQFERDFMLNKNILTLSEHYKNAKSAEGEESNTEYNPD